MAHQPFVERVGVAILGLVAEGDHRQIGRRTGIKAVELGQSRVKIAGERQLLRLRRAEGGDAGDLQREPQTKRAKMPGQLGREVGRRRTDLRLSQRADVIGAGAERIEKVLAVADQHGARAVGQEQRLVRVERDAVGKLDAGEQRAALLAQGEQPAIGAVDVEPRVVTAAQGGDLRQRIDRAGVDRPGRGNDQPRAHPVGDVALERLLKCINRHAVALVGRDLATRSATAPGDVQGLVDAIMGEARGVDRASPVGVAGIAGRDDGGEVGDASAGGQGSRRLLGIADDAGEPVGRHVLEPHRTRAGRGEAGIFVRCGGEQVAEPRMKQPAAGDVGHEAG